MTGFETAIIAGLMAESTRKQHVAGRIAREENLRQAERAEKKAASQEARNLMIRQQEKKRKDLVQTKSPFAKASTPNQTMRQQFTVGGGGNSGVNY